MRLRLPKEGRYIVAVSGGIDSVCLLDILVAASKYELIVAHFDHGIREDSALDLMFVKGLAAKYHLPFTSSSARLGPDTSEAVAREARYAFLYHALKDYGAEAILTAHHQDDRIETLLINLIRGTGRLGLASIGETETLKRPLLNVSKADLKQYASRQELKWRDDSTNLSDKYLRNYVRHHVMDKLSKEDKRRIVSLMDNQVKLNRQIDEILSNELFMEDRGRINRLKLNNLSFAESQELIASWLRLNNLFNFDRKTIERITVASKTKRPGTKLEIGRAHV